jgi:hypothetical protein
LTVFRNISGSSREQSSVARRITYAAPWLCAILLGCRSSTEPAVQPPLRTDALEYRLEPIPGGFRARLVVDYVNSGSQTVYMWRCGSLDQAPHYFFQRPVPIIPKPPWEVVTFICSVREPGTQLPPGATRRDTVWFISPEDPFVRPAQPLWQLGDLKVCYMLTSSGAEDAGPEAILPLRERCSNVFEITM